MIESAQWSDSMKTEPSMLCVPMQYGLPYGNISLRDVSEYVHRILMNQAQAQHEVKA